MLAVIILAHLGFVVYKTALIKQRVWSPDSVSGMAVQ